MSFPLLYFYTCSATKTVGDGILFFYFFYYIRSALGVRYITVDSIRVYLFCLVLFNTQNLSTASFVLSSVRKKKSNEKRQKKKKQKQQTKEWLLKWVLIIVEFVLIWGKCFYITNNGNVKWCFTTSLWC